jgi:hypothetical protein
MLISTKHGSHASLTDKFLDCDFILDGLADKALLFLERNEFRAASLANDKIILIISKNLIALWTKFHEMPSTAFIVIFNHWHNYTLSGAIFH